MLDMGEPVRILDVAKRLIARSKANIDIVFTGCVRARRCTRLLQPERERRCEAPPLDRDRATVRPANSVLYRHKRFDLRMSMTR